MRKTDIALCPDLKTQADIPDFDERIFRNIATLSGRLESAWRFEGKETVSAREVAEILDMILEVEANPMSKILEIGEGPVEIVLGIRLSFVDGVLHVERR